MSLDTKKVILSFFILFIFVTFSVSYSVDNLDSRISEKRSVISCGKKYGGGGGGESGDVGGGGGGSVVDQGYVLLRIRNSNSLSPVEGVQVYVNGTATALSSEEGTVYFSVPPGDYNIRLVKQSYAPYTFKIKVSKDEISAFDVNLSPYRFSASFNALTGGEVKDVNTGLKIVFQGGGLKRKSDGAIHTGNASIYISYLDPQVSSQLFAFPGNFVGVQNGEKVLLETFGPIEARIVSESGQELDLPSGVTAYIEFPVPDSLRGVVPASVPLWSFNENTGEWMYEGVLVKRLNEDGKEVLSGYVSHFSWWNPDIPSETTCVQGVIKDEKGNPIAGAQVWSEGVDYTGADFTGASRKTGADGKFFVFIRKGSKAKIVANVNGVRRELRVVQTANTYPSYYLKDWMQNPSSAWNVCPSEGDFVIRNIKIILRWGNKMCDLDLHITGPTSSGRFHVATKLWGRVNSNPYAEIEGDDYPEMAYIDASLPGVYRVSVFANNPNNTCCGRLLKDSGALIQVWHRGRVVFTASPPPHASGDLWKAIDITVSADGNISITEIRQIVDGDYCAPYHPNPSDERPCPTNGNPSVIFSVPSEVDGASTVYIPYYASDPDGDNIKIRVFQDDQQCGGGGGGQCSDYKYCEDDHGDFVQGNGYIKWSVPDVKSSKTTKLIFRVEDGRGGVATYSYAVTIKVPTIYKIWENTTQIAGSVFWDSEILASTETIYAIADQWWADPVIRISKDGSITNQRNFARVFDIAVTSDGVYVAYDLGGGIFGLGKYSLDLATAVWEVALTTNGRHFAKIHPTSDGLYVIFSTTSNYIIRKYSGSGTIVWETTSARAGSVSRCHDRCMKINPVNGDIYVSIFEDFTSGSDQQRILRISSSGSILSTKFFYDWSPVVVLPYGNSVYVVRLWLLLERYDANLNNLASSVNIWSYPQLEDFWISELFVQGGYLYGVGGKSFYNENLEFVRESMTVTKFDMNLNLVYGKVLGISTVADSERLFSAVISGNYLYVVGGYQVSNIFYPLVAKYKIP
ncbi:MAG: carboxypeptidase-like regulatory domain-containing protein [bacterium]|nr:carboxypeptidase-like regulatory domain-containing protein [bacterium]